MASRRTFLSTSLTMGLGAGAAMALAGAGGSGFGNAAWARATRPVRLNDDTREGLRILILGGTGFLGPAVIDAAQARGHTLTAFNRGRTEQRLGTARDGVERRLGDRDPKVGEGLKSLETGEWDAVVDTSGYVPRIVKASAELLAPRVKHYLFVSSVSVYAENGAPGADETAPIATMPDPTDENVQQHYGALKALCEQAAEAAMPNKTASVRPGLIVGPGDPTDRFTYWPWRLKQAVGERTEVLCPGTPADPVQVIDVRDLAEFIVTLIEQRSTGSFDALGPGTQGEGRGGAPAGGPLSIGQVIEASRDAAGTSPTLTWADAEFLANQNVAPWAQMPVWIPPTGATAGFHTRDVRKAVGAGLTFRPIGETVRDTLAWFPAELERRERVTRETKEKARAEGKPEPNMADPSALRAGITPLREKEVLSAWRARKGQ